MVAVLDDHEALCDVGPQELFQRLRHGGRALAGAHHAHAAMGEIPAAARGLEPLAAVGEAHMARHRRIRGHRGQGGRKNFRKLLPLLLLRVCHGRSFA